MQFIILKEGDKVKLTESYFNHPKRERYRNKILIIEKAKNYVFMCRFEHKSTLSPFHRNLLKPA